LRLPRAKALAMTEGGGIAQDDRHGERSLAMKGKEVPEDLSVEIVFTLNTTAQIAGKSCPALLRTISLLKLSDEIRAAIRNPSIMAVFIKEMHPRNKYRSIWGNISHSSSLKV